MDGLKILVLPFLSFFSVICLLLGTGIAAKNLKLTGKKENSNEISNFWKLKINNKKHDILFKKFRVLIPIVIFAICFSTSMFFLKNFVVSIFFSIMAAGFASGIIQSYKNKSNYLIELQLIDFISDAVIMMKAGKEIRQIFIEAREFTKKPLKNYLEEITNEMEANVSFDEALDDFLKLCKLKEVELMVSAIKIHKKTGGNLIYIFENLIMTLQYDLRIKSQIKTQTAQSRFSGNIISIFPIIGFLFICLFFTNPLSGYFSSSAGMIIVGIGALLEICGFFIIRRLLREETF